MSSFTTTTKLVAIFGVGLATLGATYYMLNGSKRLSEFKLMKMAVAKWKSLDTNADGKVSYDEFIAGMKHEVGDEWEALQHYVHRLYHDVQKYYESLDTDGDGEVSYSEILNALKSGAVSSYSVVKEKTSAGIQAITSTITESSLPALIMQVTTKWKELDLNGDGTVEFDEFKTGMIQAVSQEKWNKMEALYTDIYTYLVNSYLTFDTNGDGKVEFSEVQQATVEFITKSYGSTKDKASDMKSYIEALAANEFKRLDVDNNGSISLSEFLDRIKSRCPSSWTDDYIDTATTEFKKFSKYFE
jgi:Ca2+-binding EF-hand superfamily protein